MENSIDPESMPAVLVGKHGPFTWGESPEKAVENAIVLEECAEMAFRTMLISRDSKPLENYVLDKHYFRKHGKYAYYGQKK